MRVHDILRALISGDSAKLNDPAWVADAHQAIDAADPAVHAAPADPAAAGEGGGGGQ